MVRVSSLAKLRPWSKLTANICDPGNALEPPEPQKIKSDSRSGFRGFPQADRKVTPKVTFLIPKVTFFTPKKPLLGVKKVTLGIKKVTFGATFRSAWGKPRKPLPESLLFFWGSGGSRAFPGSQAKMVMGVVPALVNIDSSRTSFAYTEACPKDPAVLKTVRDSDILRRSVFTTPPRFTTP